MRKIIVKNYITVTPGLPAETRISGPPPYRETNLDKGSQHVVNPIDDLSHGPDILGELEVISVGPQGKTVRTLNHYTSVVDWPSGASNKLVRAPTK